MSPRFLGLQVAGLLVLCAPTSGQGQIHDAQPLRLRVHLQDYAGARPALLRDAIKLAQQVYRPTGVTIEWLDCTAAIRQEPAAPDCYEPMRPTILMMQLLSRKMANRVPVSQRVHGYAVPSVNRAGLFYRRIRDYSVAHGLESRALLGMAMAHEIGHLLLGKGSHRATGLMSCPWTNKDIADAARGQLRFDAKQAARIQQEVLARVEADASAALAAD